MKPLSIGKIRNLQHLANRQGIFVICAMDHRGSLQEMLSGNSPAGYQEMVDFKMDLCHALGAYASAVLLDPKYGAAQALASSALPKETGLLVSTERSGYAKAGEEGRITSLLPDWSVAKTKRMGGNGAKLLLYYRPDLLEVAFRQRETVKKLAEDCQKADLPLVVEPVAYRVQEKSAEEFSRSKPPLVVETARQITALPIDILKAEFPVDLLLEKDERHALQVCEELNQASTVPWVILSGGVDFETFYQQVEIACKAGASGFLAGRALWQDATPIASRKERMRFLKTVVKDRLLTLTKLANTYGTPWYAKLGLKEGNLSPVSGDWYKTY